MQLSLLDEQDMAEIVSPDYPGERLVVCKNPDLAAERARKRAELLAATEKDLARIKAAVERERSPLRGQAKIALKVGAVLGRRKMAKHFRLTISDDSLSFARDDGAIAKEAALDGFVARPRAGPRPDPGVLRTSLPAATLDAEATVRAYKSLAGVERAFRSLKSVDLEVRPVHHRPPACGRSGPEGPPVPGPARRLAGRVRAHVFLCMLAYHLTWHLRRALAPLLFEDHDRAAAAIAKPSPVAAARVSPAAAAKAASRRNAEGQPVHSWRSLLRDLATLTRNTVRLGDAPPVTMLTRPTPLQQDVFDRLAIAL